MSSVESVIKRIKARRFSLTRFPVAKGNDVHPGSMKGIEIEGKKMLITNVEGQFYAMRSIYNYKGDQLDKGKLECNVATCLLQGSKWDVKSDLLVKFARPLPRNQFTRRMFKVRALF